MKNKIPVFLGAVFLLLSLSVLTGCFDAAQSGGGPTQTGGGVLSLGNTGGGSSGTGNTGGGSSGTGRASVSVGTISGFGSVFMNGVRYDTRSATITINGAPASESDLRTGMVGRIAGNVDALTGKATASTLDVTFTMVGAVEQIDLPLEKLVVVGQNVILNPFTIFVNGVAETLAIGDIVAVSGLTNSDGAVVASYIEIIAPGGLAETELAGEISGLDAASRIFRIGDQAIDYALARFIDTTVMELSVGLAVRVTGQLLPGNIIGASSVQNLASRPIAEQDDILDLEGIVREPLLATRFTLASTRVTTSPATVYVGGNSGDVIENARLKVRGKVTVSGELEAESIEFSIQPDITLIGGVESVNVSANRVSISGQSIEIDSSTRMLDNSGAAIQRFSVNDIRVGDQITVYGTRSAATVKALFLRRDAVASAGENPLGEVTIRGLSEITGGDPFFEAGGVTVDTTGMSNAGAFLDASLNPISRSEFFAAVQQGAFVQVTGVYITPALVAGSARLLGRGNMTIMDTSGSPVAGANDLLVAWDGSLNTEADVVNGTTAVNMFITSKQTILGFPWFAHDIRVFGPGSYSFDTCVNQASAVNCGILQMTVGPDQVGVHMLLDWNLDTNVDVVNVWDRNRVFCADVPGSACATYMLAADGSIVPELGLFNWNLVSTDDDQDGIAGVFLVDGGFANSITINFNLDL